MIDLIRNLPQSLLSGLIVAVAVIVLFLPLALRLAGLSGQQILELLQRTMQFVLDLVAEFRANNKSE